MVGENRLHIRCLETLSTQKNSLWIVDYDTADIFVTGILK